MHSNLELTLAHDFVEYTDRHVFLTGKAGTGKTTFLHNLKGKTHKRLVVTAPTGVAAINAGGVTLHSFFQLPFGPFVPGSEDYGRHNQHKFSKEKINLIKSLDLLVIDEISMVRADLLDGVDSVLRRFRKNDLAFGGVQLLMIGDLHQLSPVVKDDDWAILSEFYDSMYFFGSRALSRTELITIELKQIFRQSDTRFIDLLNRVRDNRLDQASLSELNSRHLRGFAPDDGEGYITLSTHNHSAEAINQARLKALKQKEYSFQAEVTGDFPEYSYPTSLALTLKKGAQVMFVKNDPAPDKLYFNGKIGQISKIADKTVYVKCPGDTQEILVEQAIWENIKYRVDPETREITEDKIGRFTQLPLKLAWAITIHKSQGLTFERAIIDAKAAFAHGQVYVALSRCKTFEGLVLSSAIPAHAVKTDAAVSRFITQAGEAQPCPAQLETARIGYQQRLLTECFTFGRLRSALNRLARTLLINSRTIKVSGIGDLHELEHRAGDEIFTVGDNFNRQLSRLLAGNSLPESDAAICERVGKASAYFTEKLEAVFGDCLRNLRLDTDNQELAKKAKFAADELKKETVLKLAAIRSCANGFSPSRYLRALSNAEIDLVPAKEKKSKAVQYTASEVGHPELFQTLKDWRAAKAAEADVPHYQILHQSVLIQISVTLPDSPAALLGIKGIGKRLVDKFGRELLGLVTDYRQKHGIQEVVLPAPKALVEPGATAGNPGKPDTKLTSLEMFNQGLTVRQVAQERGLVTATVEGHLAHFVEAGRLEIGRLLAKEKLSAIEDKLVEMPDKPLGEIRQALGDNFSYGEIKLVQAHRRYLASQGDK